MRRLLVVPTLALLSTTAVLAQGNQSVGIAADVGAAVPIGDFARDGAKFGLSLGATATLRVTSIIGVYASVERSAFPVKSSAGAPGDGTWTDIGVGGGVRLWLPARDDQRLRPWAQVGLALHNLDAPIADTRYAVIDTKGLRTIEGGAGLDIALGSRRIWFLRPTVRYRRYAFAVETPTVTETTKISYLSFGAGLVMALGHGSPAR